MGKMNSRAKRRRLIELRGQGVSYVKIAEEIGSSRSTVIRWSLELDVHIKNAVNLEFENLKEEYLVTRDHQIKMLATQLNNVAQELVKRDLSKVPAQKLMEMQTHLRKEMQAKFPEMEFFRKIPFGGNAAIRKILNHTDSWEA
jgi:IS30 family transposase